MLLLIDGYNLLKKIKHTSYISDKERENFIKKIVHYAYQKKLLIYVIFDGGPYNWPLTQTINSFVTVVYSGVRESADDCIKQYVEEHADTDILLITSDRELVTYARQYRIASMGSYEFLEFLNDHEKPCISPEHQGQQAHKIATSDNQELDTLMHRLTVPKHAKEPEEHAKAQKKVNQLSKAERKLLKKIKKL